MVNDWLAAVSEWAIAIGEEPDSISHRPPRACCQASGRNRLLGCEQIAKKGDKLLFPFFPAKHPFHFLVLAKTEGKILGE